MRTYLLPLYALLFLALARPAFAVDGVLEINQTCAVQTGCFSGDTAGYPVTIDGTAGRSYRLTGDLIVPDENTSGIVVSTSDIGIDLNNFTITRSGCEGAATDCTPASGFGTGVERDSPLNRGISVKNGSVTGMGFYGVRVGDQAEVSGLRVRWNRLDGIFAGTGSTVSDNTAYANGATGIVAGDGSTVQRNIVRSNAAYGLALGSEAAYRENVITDNSMGAVFGLVGVNRGDNFCAGTGVVSSICP
ncbi:MAG: right-handed parallel beta-helix repeat-containing protein [Deltaproteobacteria bacterium]|nr:right-handed parallel beta-helix repeat-containing protein [Deltaproteobacteria bacterium]